MEGWNGSRTKILPPFRPKTQESFKPRHDNLDSRNWWVHCWELWDPTRGCINLLLFLIKIFQARRQVSTHFFQQKISQVRQNLYVFKHELAIWFDVAHVGSGEGIWRLTSEQYGLGIWLDACPVGCSYTGESLDTLRIHHIPCSLIWHASGQFY